MAAAAWTEQALLAIPASYIPPAKLPAIQAAALAACDRTVDGVLDGIVGDPRDCHFNPAVLQCIGPDSNTCLTRRPGHRAAAQLRRAAQKRPASFPKWTTGPTLAQISNALLNQFATNFYRFMVFDNPTFDIRTLTFDGGARARARTSSACGGRRTSIASSWPQECCMGPTTLGRARRSRTPTTI